MLATVVSALAVLIVLAFIVYGTIRGRSPDSRRNLYARASYRSGADTEPGWGLAHRLGGEVIGAGFYAIRVEGKLDERSVEITLHSPPGGHKPVDLAVETRSQLLLDIRAAPTKLGFQLRTHPQSPPPSALEAQTVGNEAVLGHLTSLFTRWGVDRVLVCRGRVTASLSDGDELDPEDHETVLRTLHRVEQLARAIEAVADPPPVAPVVRARASASASCPYCKDALSAELEVVSCPACATPHHAACFEELGRCTTLGCNESAPATAFRVRRLT